MVTQTQICYKIDSDLLEKLDDMAIRLEQKRNFVINTLVRIGLDYLSQYEKCALISVYAKAYRDAFK